MTSMRRASLWVSCLLALSASPGFAQSDPAAEPGPPPAHVSIIEGQAFIDRDGRSDAAVANLPLLDGDRLRTEEGRLEVILPDGSLLHVDRHTTVDVMAADLLRLLKGRVYVIVRGVRNPATAARYQIDTPIASAQTGSPGEFRTAHVDTPAGPEAELAVFRGQATLANDFGAQGVRAGERSVVREGFAPSDPQYFNSARWDEFDRWSAARRDERLGTASVQYLPAELEVYASTFDRYGTWRYEPDEGSVWYPTVAVDWRPYSVGYWGSYPAWGSFWIGGDPWGWPTHHYGHWGFSFGIGWYWAPAAVWAPSWVYWAYSPGYVSWCPVGRYGYPVFGHFGVRGAYYGHHVDPWRGWTVVPRQHFGPGRPVHRAAIDGNRLDPLARGAFAARREGPSQGRAVPRYASGGMAVPRSGGAAVPRGGGAAVPRGGDATTAVPRTGGARGLPDSGSRSSPAEAARILGGGRPQSGNPAVRRVFPPSGATGTVGQRTEAPPATPDVTAFGSRRNPAPALPGSTGTRTGTIFDNGARARTYPRALPSAPGPSNTTQDVSRRRGSWADGTQGSPRDSPYVRGDSGATPDAYGLRRAPERYSAPQNSQPRSESPRYSPPQHSQPQSEAPSWRSATPPRQPAPSSRPRDGGGVPAGQAVRRGGGPETSSSPSSAPRYNPGSAASHQRGGGSSPPPSRRRGGVPD